MEILHQMRNRERERRAQRKRREQEIRLQMFVLAVGAALLLFLVIVGIEPWFKLDMQLGEGSGCTMSFAVMEAACAILERMATFFGTKRDKMSNRLRDFKIGL